MQYIDMETLKYLLFEVQDTERVLEFPRHEAFDKEAINMLLDSVKDFGDQDLYPIFKEMDEDPARYEDGTIVTHPKLGELMRKAAELGLISDTFDEKFGGMQVPYTAHTAMGLILDAANNQAPGYWLLTQGAADLIVHFGSEELQQTYVPNMMAGEWGGTMALTEPQAGSSLSDIKTSATPQEDGSYKIKGHKIFISGGDHQHVDNIVHLLLARIDGAPAGTKGISLFVVPKNRITSDGLVPNDVITAGDFEKMGQKGYCTTHLVFGDKDDCKAWLVGEPHQGLKYMFKMMNGARIDVGRGANAITHAAYHASLKYANERPQGRPIQNAGKKDALQEPVLIINHPDVRRMLLLQKAIAEASTSLIFEAALYHDIEMNSQDPEEKGKYHLLLELLTPIVKTYPSEMGRIAVNNGLQVLGGYGFCSDFILQQYYRDIRIFSIYEGTTGIQSIDLLGRKLTMEQGKAMKLLASEMKNVIEDAMAIEELRPYGKQLLEKLELNKEVMTYLMNFAMKGDYQRFLSDATIFMEFFGTIIIGWQWLKIAVKAKQSLLTGDNSHKADFFQSKIHTMKFFYKYEMPRTTGLAEILTDETLLTLPSEEEVFA